MKGFRKSILMGAALALLLSAEAEAMSAGGNFSESTSGILTEAEQEISLKSEVKAVKESDAQALSAEPAQSDLESAAEAGPAEAGQTEEAGPEVDREPAQSDLESAAEAEPTEAGQMEEAGPEADQGAVPETVTEAAQMEEMKTEAEPEGSYETEAAAAALREEVQTESPKELNMAYLTVTWRRETEEGEIVYIQGENDAEIAAIDTGIWELYIEVALQAAGIGPLTNGRYFCSLIWPSAADPGADLSGESGNILIGEDRVCGTWTLSKGGELTLTLEGINDISAGCGWIKTFIQAGEAEAEEPVERPANPSVKKEGLYDAAAQKVFWTAEVTVPAWDGKSTYSWCLRDTEKMMPGSLAAYFKNDYSGLSVEGEEGTACFFEEAADGSALIWFLNPCTCEGDGCEKEEPGQSESGGCGQIKYIDDAGQAWCACWHRSRNSRFTLGYTADTAELQQQMQESGITEAVLNNDAELLQSGVYAGESLAGVSVHEAIKKAESERPDISNGYSSTCRITVNPSFDDYSGAEQIEVTDVMDNLTYISESLQIICRYSDGTEEELTQMDGEEAAALGREGNENRYFSMETSEDGQSFSVSLWYPTQASYILTYRAAVTELVPGAETTYRNTASLGRVSSTVRGKGFQVDDAWFGETFEAVVLKIDEDSGTEDPLGLAGAVFEVRQVSADGEDLLVDTLTTGEDGKDVFRTDREKGVLVNRNTLYYLQEKEAPKGYERKKEKYYFYFSPADDMVLPEGITAAKGEKKEDADISTYTLTLVVPNQAVLPKELPAAGGPGEALFFLIGLFFVIASEGTVLPGRMH